MQAGQRAQSAEHLEGSTSKPVPTRSASTTRYVMQKRAISIIRHRQESPNEQLHRVHSVGVGVPTRGIDRVCSIINHTPKPHLDDIQAPGISEDDIGYPKIKVGVCAMDKKARSKPMLAIMERLTAYGEFEIVPFGDDVILNAPWQEWPLCDCLLSWFSDGFPLKKVCTYNQILASTPPAHDIHITSTWEAAHQIHIKCTTLIAPPSLHHLYCTPQPPPHPPPHRLSSMQQHASPTSSTTSSYKTCFLIDARCIEHSRRQGYQCLDTLL